MDVELYLPEDWFTADKAELMDRYSCRAGVQYEDRARLEADPAGACSRHDVFIWS